MYTEFYGLSEKPFALVPDPRYLFMATSHREALAHLLYGIEEGEGFIEVIGQVGTGKTTLCRTLVRRVGPEVDIAFIFNPSTSETELLSAINREFGIATAVRSRDELLDELNRYLLERKRQGRRAILIIDEAQNLEPPVLEQIRLLSNLETEREKLLQIILIGQPELDEHLARPDMRQLRQRITVRWSLDPCTPAETAAYLEHRLRVAGSKNGELFSPAAVRMIYQASRGVPRLINAVADRSLLGGYSAGRKRIGRRLVRRSVKELPGAETIGVQTWLGVPARVAVVLLVGGLVLGIAVAGIVPFVTGELPLEPIATVYDGNVQPVSESAITADPKTVVVAPMTSPLVVAATPVPALERELGLALEDVLAVETAESSAGRALDALLASWGYPSLSRTGVDPNLFGSAVREVSPLRVFATRADQEMLRVLDLPAVLEVEVTPSERRYVAVVGVDADGVWQLALGERTFAVEPSGLDRIATGRTFFAWTNFESLPAMQLGMQGSAVRWLQARLAELGYLRLGDPSGQFDEPTLAAVRSFQNDLALDPTGAVGPETLIGLYQVLHYGAPRLAPAVQGEVS